MRLFIAIEFEDKAYFDSLRAVLPEGATLTKTKAAHLTLNFLGEVTEQELEHIQEVLRSVTPKPFSLTTSKIDYFDKTFLKVIVLAFKSSQAITDLYNATVKLFPTRKQKKFNPHITLARIRKVKDKKEYIEKLKALTAPKKTFKITQFKLIQSSLTPDGPVYQDIEVYPLK